MQRRSFLKKVTIGAGVAAIGAPAIAQSLPTLNWRLVSSFPKSLDTLFGAPEVFANSLRKATDGKFNVKVFAAGEVAGGKEVDARDFQLGRGHRALVAADAHEGQVVGADLGHFEQRRVR